MPLTQGTRLGPYEILALTGAGGMGEVYKARDTRLDRIVAVKVLPSALSQDPDRRQRLERESRAIAALAHPNICTLHDVGQQNGIDFLVMEYLEGETLAARIARQPARTPFPQPEASPSPAGVSRSAGLVAPPAGVPLPLDETLHIATQLADALAAAHRAGVVHRDLKPGNVMITRTGIKVLDFGLAKLRAESSDATAAVEQTMTAAAPLTHIGQIVGTLPYMSPEQLEGRETDTRSDIFAFGAIVYELTTGKRAFVGGSQASLVAAILNLDPQPITVEQPLATPGLDRLVRKCLAKNPDDRWQTASDVADELRWLASGSGGTTGVVLPQPPAGQRRHLWRWGVAAGAAVIATAVTAWLWTRGREARQTPEVKHTQVTFAGNVLQAAISPDGRTVAYGIGEQQKEIRVLVRDLAGGRALEVWRGTLLVKLRWLPDGTRVVVSGMKSGSSHVWLIPRLGGEPRRLAEFQQLFAISPDSSLLTLASGNSRGFFVVPVNGGASRKIELAGFSWLHHLDWSARTNRLALTTSDEVGTSMVWTVAPDGQGLRRIHTDSARIRASCWSPVEDVLYLLRTQNEASEVLRLRVNGRDQPAPEVLLTGLPVTAPDSECSVSTDGQRLLYVRQFGHANLWKLPLAAPAAAATTLTEGTGTLRRPSVSPDGQWIAAMLGSGSRTQIVKFPAGGGDPTPLTDGWYPEWSPDGRRLAFVKNSNAPNIWISEVDGSQAKEVPDSSPLNGLMTWLPDNRLAWQTHEARNYRIRDLASGREDLLVKDPSVGYVFVPRFSPGGDQVAVYWNRQGDAHDGLWVLSWPRREARFLAKSFSPAGWSRDGEWIYAYVVQTPTIVRVSARTGTVEPVGSFPSGVLGLDGCGVSADGSVIVCSLNETKTDAWILEDFDPQAPPRSQ